MQTLLTSEITILEIDRPLALNVEYWYLWRIIYTVVSLIEIIAAWLIFWVDIKISIQKVNYAIFYSSVWISASYWSK